MGTDNTCIRYLEVKPRASNHTLSGNLTHSLSHTLPLKKYQTKKTPIRIDKVDEKHFQHTTMDMKINLGLKYSLVSLISNSICLHSTRIYAPFQPDKNLILGNKPLQIEFKGGGKKTAFPNYFQSSTTTLQLKGTRKAATTKAELTYDPWIQWH